MYSADDLMFALTPNQWDKPGSWYYTATIYGMDHGDYCGTTDDYPEGYEKFWLGLADMATSR